MSSNQGTSSQRRRIVRQRGGGGESSSKKKRYKMPSGLEECFRCKGTPVYTKDRGNYIGAGTYHKYYCPECGQGAKNDLHTPDGQEHAALLWNDAQWKGRLHQRELDMMGKKKIARQIPKPVR